MYIQTIPSFECQAYVNQCVMNSGSDAQAIRNCRAIPCATLDPVAAESAGLASSTVVSTSTRAVAASSGSGSTATTAAAAAATTTRASGAESNFGTGSFLGGMVALIAAAGL